MSRRFLAIDCGNTRLKATLLPLVEDGVEARDIVGYVFDMEEVDAMVLLIEQLGVSSAAMSASGHIDPRLVETVRESVDGNFLLMTPSTPLPVGIDYEGERTLGLDRKAAAAGVVALWPGEKIVVVDCGTAMTIDRVDAEGVFRGGNISPGLSMRFEALHRLTARLPLVDRSMVPVEIPSVGKSTMQAIECGAGGGLLDEICMAAMRAAKDGVGRMVVTGGDAQWVMQRLPARLAEAGIEIELNHEPDLLAFGLRAIFIENEKNI